MKKVAVIQSNYIPWKGYFDIIHDVDLFVFFDDVEYSVGSWRNRNKIKTLQGLQWLTVPVGKKGSRLIHEVQISDASWGKAHWKSIKQTYSKSPYFKKYREFFEYIYLDQTWTNLSKLNQYLVKKISHDYLRIKTKFKDSREYHAQGDKLDRLLDLLVRTNANYYVSGPSAKDYIDDERFSELGIVLHYKSYSGYPKYSQSFPPFRHKVTILDLLFNCGPDAPYYIWGWRD